MARIDRVRSQYERITEQLFSDSKAFADYLTFSGRFFKLPASSAITIFADNPKATIVADYDTWQKYGRQVKRGYESIAVLSEGKLKHYFDISLTSGDKVPYQWSLNKALGEQLASSLSRSENTKLDSVTSCIEHLANAEVSDKITDLTSSLNISENDRAAFEKSVSSMVKAVMGARCEFPDSDFKYNGNLDMAAHGMLKSAAELERLAQYVQIMAKNSLLIMENSIRNIINERSVGYEERGRFNERAADMVRGGSDVLPRIQGEERQDLSARQGEVRVQSDARLGADGGRGEAPEQADTPLGERVAEVYGGTLPDGDTLSESEYAVGDNSEGDRPRSETVDGNAQRTVSENEAAPDGRVPQNSTMGERAENSDRSTDNGGLSSRQKDIIATTAEVEAPAVSSYELDDDDYPFDNDEPEKEERPALTLETLIADVVRNGNEQRVFGDDYLSVDDEVFLLPENPFKDSPLNAIKEIQFGRRGETVTADKVNEYLKNNPDINADKVVRISADIVENIEGEGWRKTPFWFSSQDDFAAVYSRGNMNNIDYKRAVEHFFPQKSELLTALEQRREVYIADDHSSGFPVSNAKAFSFTNMRVSFDEENGEYILSADAQKGVQLIEGAYLKGAKTAEEMEKYLVENAYTISGYGDEKPEITEKLSPDMQYITDKVKDYLRDSSDYKGLYADFLAEMETDSALADAVYSKAFEYAYEYKTPIAEIPKDDLDDIIFEVLDSKERSLEQAERAAEAVQAPDEDEQMRLTPKPLDKKQQKELEKLIKSLEYEYSMWERIRLDGNSEAHWEDGSSLNLVRNHIIYDKHKLEENFPDNLPDIYYREMPPEMPMKYQTVKAGDTLRFEVGDFLVLRNEESPSGEYFVELQDANGEIITQNLRDIKGRFENLTNRGELPSKVISAVRVGDFYELYGEDARKAAQTLDLTLTKKNGEDMAGFPKFALDNYKQQLENAGFILNIRGEQLEIPANLDKFDINSENETVYWTYYNPDSDKGGQFVLNTFTYDRLLDALGTTDPLDYLSSVSKTELIDADSPNFRKMTENFLLENEDFNSRDEHFLDKLSAVVEPYYEIYQLKKGDELHFHRFEPLERLKNAGLSVERENYDIVYRARMKPDDTLEGIYTRLNHNHPDGYKGHSLSVSDIVAVHDKGKVTANYVDDIGFAEIPDFMLTREEREARKQRDTHTEARSDIARIARLELALDSAKERINEYIQNEFNENADFSDMSRIELAYTTDAETDFPIQIYADLENFKLVKLCNDAVISEKVFESSDDMLGTLGNLEFDELVALDDNERSIAREYSEKHFSDYELMRILNRYDYIQTPKLNAAAYLLEAKSEKAKADYLKTVYNNEYSELIIDDERYGYKPEFEGLRVWKGSYLSNEKEEIIGWGKVAELTDRLIRQNDFLDGQGIIGAELSGEKAVERDNSLTITIPFSEHPAFYDREGEYSFALANKILGVLDEKQHKEREIEDNHVGWYHKTDFEITAVINGEEFKYEGRFDIGDGEGDLLDHIKNAYEYYLSDKTAQMLHLDGENYKKYRTSWESNRDILYPFLQSRTELTIEDNKRFEEFMASEKQWFKLPERSADEIYNSLTDENKDMFNSLVLADISMLRKALDNSPNEELREYDTNRLDGQMKNYADTLGITVSELDKLVNEKASEFDKMVEAISEPPIQSNYKEQPQLNLFGEPMEETKPDNEKTIIGGVDIDEALKYELIRHGTGFQDGKFRVEKYYKEEAPKTKDFAKLLAKEYGIGGHYGGDGIIKGASTDGKGMELEIKLDNGETTKVSWNWNKIAARVAELIDNNEYITEHDIEGRIRNARYETEHYKPDTYDYQYAAKVLEEYGLLPKQETPINEPRTEIIDWSDFTDEDFKILQTALNEKIILNGNDTCVIPLKGEEFKDLQLEIEIKPYVDEWAVDYAIWDNAAENYYNLGGYQGADSLQDIEEFKTDIENAIAEELPSIREIIQERETAKTIAAFKEETEQHFKPISGEKPTSIEAEIGAYAKALFDYNEIEAEIIGVAVTGSRSRGIEGESSDLDVVIEVKSEMKEHALFDILNEEEYTIGGVTVDINPIRAEETGTLDEYLKKADEYLENKTKEKAAAEDLSNTQKQSQEIKATDFMRAMGVDVVNMDEPEQDAPVQNNEVKLKSMVIDLENNRVYEQDYQPPEQKFPPKRATYSTISDEKTPYELFSIGKEITHNDRKFQVEKVTDSEVKFTDLTFYESAGRPISLAVPISEAREMLEEYERGLEQNEQKDLPDQLSLSDITEDIYDNAAPAAPSPKPKAKSSEPKLDFTITDENLGVGGAKTKFAANIAAIKTLKAIEAENRLASPDEQETLSRYVGWGGIPQAFDGANKDWQNEYNELRGLLTDEEYEKARATTLNAHYTTPTVINAIYKALDGFGFKGGNVLEPAMGIGNFFGVMPAEMRENSRLSGVELDDLTGRIAKQLYQNADIQIKGYEETEFPDNFFDVAIGNVPFGNYQVADTKFNKENFLIHDYFFAKTLDKVAPNGIIAFVTSKGTLDKENAKVREYIAKRADLIGAIRLPGGKNGAFSANANTEVTTDIIFLQKREKLAVELPDWCYIGRNEDGLPVNQYFIDNPEMMLGTMQPYKNMYGNDSETACIAPEGQNLAEELGKAVARLKRNIAVARREEEKNAERGIIPATADVRNFTFTEINGKMYFRENNIMKEVWEGKIGKEAPIKGKRKERMRGMIEIREIFRKLIDAQTRNCTDTELGTIQTELNNKYDAFVKKFGYISNSTNSSVFSDDDDYNTICALEEVNAETKQVKKSDIFTKRTIKPVMEITHVDTAQEALQVCLDVAGKVDIGFMAALCEADEEKIIADLTADNLIYKNPETNAYEEAAEYLSGNVRIKLREAEKAAEENPEFTRNVAALEKAIPPILGAGEISVRIGVPWVSKRDYMQFLEQYAQARFTEPLFKSITGEYTIPSKSWDKSVAATQTFGTSRMNSYAIFERLLNNRDIAVYDRVEMPDGKDKRVINKKETQLAQEKARQMKEAFPKWLWSDQDRREKYVKIYNELFNSIVGREYNGANQSFPGMSPFITLNEHQKNAVMRAKLGGNTLLAHCVGAGKSFEMAAATMEKKRLGLINKACVVVPKHLVGQMAAEWKRLYPEAKLLTASEKDFDQNHRQRFIARCCTGDYDAVIMSYQQFEKIQMSVEYKKQFLFSQVEKITSAMNDYGGNRHLNSEDKRSVKDLEKVKKSLDTKIKKLLDAKQKDTSLNFEQLGFDCLVVDEAHNCTTRS